MLDAGRIETWLLTLPLAKATWRQLGFTKELVAGDVIFELPVYLVSGLDLPDETADAYVQAIAAMEKDGTLARLRKKYLD
jgi:ABC-type amino acid transport substrate-binding protein